jgi:tetratricopeptide (TPR) repeat protein
VTTPVSRREVLAVGVSAAAGLLGGSAAAAPVPKGEDNKSWVGKTVLPKKPDPVAVYKDPPPTVTGPIGPDGTPLEVTRTLHGASWEVKSERGTRVEVIEDGIACWIERREVVLLADAVEFYTKAVKDDPNDPYPRNFRGWAQYLLGKPDEAIKDFSAFLELTGPGSSYAAPIHRAVGLSNRGLVLAEQGKFDDALKDLDEAVKLGHVPAQLNRGWAYELKGDYKRAADEYAAILNLRPYDVLALNNMAWLRATCPEAALRDGGEAVKLAKRVCELAGTREGMFLDTLAAAHAEAGDFAAAVKNQELALEDNGYTRKYGADAQKRPQLYKDKKPYRTAPLK